VCFSWIAVDLFNYAQGAPKAQGILYLRPNQTRCRSHYAASASNSFVVNTEVFHPSNDSGISLRRKLGIPEESRLVRYVGRLTPEKNVRTLLEAFEILHNHEPGKYHLLTVGDGR
jgi:glycosyltransferase involved in cell wall biosynthesis